MKSLRRSLHKDSAQHQHNGGGDYSGPVPVLQPLSKPVSAVVPPKKVIRALESHRSTNPQELSFNKGDFFYVIRDVDAEGFYEANNPASGARGLVPRRLFEEFGKNNAHQRMSTPIGPGTRISVPSPTPSQASFPKSPKPTSVYYAVVQHDFYAERPDELDAKTGDTISVVAHSNREWFVAKPIGKLGGPGLIPSSFVELRNPATGQPITDVEGLIDRGEIPRVEEWKTATLNYKATSIALGKIDDDVAVVNSQFQALAVNGQGNGAFSPYGPPGSGSPPYGTNRGPLPPSPPPGPPNDDGQPDFTRLDKVSPLPHGVLVRAEVVSFHLEDEDWHFRINATFRPDPPSTTNPFDPNPNMARELTLYRVYDDFYVFQILLLEAFPLEAGRDPDHPGDPPEEEDDEAANRRILPFMPGPQDDVDEVVTDSRRRDLDIYMQELIGLRNLGAEHILRSDLVRKFFAAREGDIENEVAMEAEEEYGIPNAADYGAPDPNKYYGAPQGQRAEERETKPLYEYDTQYDDRPQTNDSAGSYLGARSQTPSTNGFSAVSRPQHPYAQTHARGQSGSSGAGSKVDRSSAASSDWNGGPGSAPPSAPSYGKDPHMSGTSSFGAMSPSGMMSSPPSAYGMPNAYPSPSLGSALNSPVPPPSSSPTHIPRDYERDPNANTNSFVSGSSHGHGGATGANPPISASNPNTAFVKVKIFHSSTDDLIAIRVSPRVTLRQMMEKVRERLGASIETVRYRDGLAGGNWEEILDDADLRGWMASGDKLVLYAE